MSVDVDGGLAAIRAAGDFEWSWSTGDVVMFSGLMGWHIESESEYGAIIRTNFALGLRIAQSGADEGVVNHINFNISAKPDPDDFPGLAEVAGVFDSLVNMLTLRLGDPVDGEPVSSIGTRIRWDLPRVVIFLSLVRGVIWVQLANPDWQRQQEEWDRKFIG
ncbi:DUF6301 family protein [Nocardia noduli]|uniref:DUF6301 family protein n=1 Tax=Nocardia noduli TaxID=2815722 RepID=UPI001C2482DE|nr:DUF6301 family protein [Nocardia noduli]